MFCRIRPDSRVSALARLPALCCPCFVLPGSAAACTQRDARLEPGFCPGGGPVEASDDTRGSILGHPSFGFHCRFQATSRPLSHSPTAGPPRTAGHCKAIDPAPPACGWACGWCLVQPPPHSCSPSPDLLQDECGEKKEANLFWCLGARLLSLSTQGSAVLSLSQNRACSGLGACQWQRVPPAPRPPYSALLQRVTSFPPLMA